MIMAAVQDGLIYNLIRLIQGQLGRQPVRRVTVGLPSPLLWMEQNWWPQLPTFTTQQIQEQTWTATTSFSSIGLSSVASSADGTKLIAAAMAYPGGGGHRCLPRQTQEQLGFGQIRLVTMPMLSLHRQMEQNWWQLIVAAEDALHSPYSGAAWTVTSLNSSQSFIASSADGTKLAATQLSIFSSVPIYVSADSGKSWAPTSATSTQWSSIASSADGNKLVAAACNIYTPTFDKFGSNMDCDHCAK